MKHSDVSLLLFIQWISHNYQFIPFFVSKSDCILTITEQFWSEDSQVRCYVTLFISNILHVSNRIQIYLNQVIRSNVPHRSRWYKQTVLLLHNLFYSQLRRPSKAVWDSNIIISSCCLLAQNTPAHVFRTGSSGRRSTPMSSAGLVVSGESK